MLDEISLVGRSEECEIFIDDTSVSRRHAELRRLEDGRFELVDLDSKFGSYVNNVEILSKGLSDGDLVRFGKRALYRFDAVAGKLEPCDDAIGMSLDFQGVSVTLGMRTVLNSLNFSIHPDELVAVIGPSGCGKSTLLSALVGGCDFTEGEILYDGDQDLQHHRREFLDETGVVPQAELLHMDLKVEEALMFAARIRMPGASSDLRRQRVDEAIVAVDLTDHRDKLVGVLSGGQRKRVNVAVELITKPRLLLLDEPTSGLDPILEKRLFDKFRGLSRRGMTVVAVVHATDLSAFDRVLALRVSENGGEIAFYGPPEEFDTERFIQKGADQQDESHDTVYSERREKPNRRFLRGWHHRQSDQQPPARQVVAERTSAHITTTLHRSFTGFWRDFSAVAVTVALPVAVAILIVLSQKEKSGVAHICFFVVISTFWMGMNSSVRELVRERKLFIRDKQAGLLPRSYLLGKFGFTASIAALQAILAMVTTVLMIRVMGERNPGSSLYMIWYTMDSGAIILSFIPVLASAAGGAAVGLIVSSLAYTERTAVAALPLLLLPQILLSRVAYGDASALPDKAPFGSVLSFPDAGFVDWLLYLGSIGFITRPSSMVMSMSLDPNVKTGTILTEWVYLALCLWLFGFLLVKVFDRCNEGWRDYR